MKHARGDQKCIHFSPKTYTEVTTWET